jgi:hypothetical protein
MVGMIREALDVLHFCDPGQDQSRLHATLKTGQDIRVHTISNHDRMTGMRPAQARHPYQWSKPWTFSLTFRESSSSPCWAISWSEESSSSGTSIGCFPDGN